MESERKHSLTHEFNIRKFALILNEISGFGKGAYARMRRCRNCRLCNWKYYIARSLCVRVMDEGRIFRFDEKCSF